jgi:Fe2+ or Zn2+ uptake regulation protein
LEFDKQHRMTHQRKLVLEEVKKFASHPTADEIYERVRKRLPKISLGTVYRNLDILASCGYIKKMGPGPTQMRFDGDTHEHLHVSCITCGAFEDAPIELLQDPLDNLENAVGRLTKFGIFGHKLEFIGLCSKCMEKERGGK